MMSAPPSSVRGASWAEASSTEEMLANATSDSITTAVVPDGRRAAPYCSAQLPTMSSIDSTTATVAQVALAWALQLGYAVIPSSTKRENLASNLLAQSLRLDADDMARIATLERNGREVSPDGLAPNWD